MERKLVGRILVLVAVLALVSVMMTGCLPGDGAASPWKPAGFLWGIWHGWVAPISLIVQIFNKNIRIYEPKEYRVLVRSWILHGYPRWFWRVVFSS